MLVVTTAPDGEEYITFWDAEDERAYNLELGRAFMKHFVDTLVAEVFDPILKDALRWPHSHRNHLRSKFHRKRPRF